MARQKELGKNSEERINKMVEYEEIYISRIEKGKDKGAKGKLFEVMCRDFLNKRMLEKDFRCRSMGKADAMKKIDGQMIRFEMKSGCGVLCEDLNIEAPTEPQLLSKADIIIYVKEFDELKPAEEQGKVFTRQEFLDALASYNDKGLDTWIKTQKKGEVYKVNIQEFKTSKKKTAHLEAILKNAPTLAQWLGARA